MRTRRVGSCHYPQHPQGTLATFVPACTTPAVRERHAECIHLAIFGYSGKKRAWFECGRSELPSKFRRTAPMSRWLGVPAVYLPYCDGASWAGRTTHITRKRVAHQKERDKVFYRGNYILDATIDELLARGMDRADEVVVSGASAGGLAVYMHVDTWAAKIAAAAEVRDKAVRAVAELSGGFTPLQKAAGAVNKVYRVGTARVSTVRLKRTLRTGSVASP
jgi:hypothetical protein